MSIENKILVGHSDVLSIQYTCCRCGTSLTIPLGKHEHVPNGCAACGTPWSSSMSDPKQSDIYEMVRTIHDVQRSLTKLSNAPQPVKYALELNGHGMSIQS